jgi:S-adenosylhomocysteine hydrolase
MILDDGGDLSYWINIQEGRNKGLSEETTTGVRQYKSKQETFSQ